MAEEIAKLYAKIGADASSFEKTMNGVDDRLNKTGGGFSKFAKVMGGVAVAGAAAFGAAMFKASKQAMNMEQRVADISAAMALTGKETKQVQKLITDLGLDPKLKVSAEEAADAIEMLGKNGLSLDKILGGAARSTVLLSNATGGDFALSADIATSALQAFGLEASAMNEAVNLIAGTTIQSKFGIEDYSLALAQAGGVASATGVNFYDFNTTIAAISPLFGSGSDAGTSFKTMLQRLVPSSNEALDAMRDLGLFTGHTKDEFEDAQEKIKKLQMQIAELDPTSKNYTERLHELQQKLIVLRQVTDDGSNAFFNADGSMKQMAEISGILQNALSGLSDEQKNAALSTIFGTDAMRAAVGLANVGEEGFRKLADSIESVDSEQMASTRMNTLAGKLEILRGQIDANVTSIGMAFLPLLSSVVGAASEWIGNAQPNIDAFFQNVATGISGFVQGWLDADAQADTFSVEFGQTMRSTADSVAEHVGRLVASLDTIAGWFMGTGAQTQGSAAQFFGRIAMGVAKSTEILLGAVADMVQSLALMGQAWQALKAGDWQSLMALDLAIRSLQQNASWASLAQRFVDEIGGMWNGQSRATGGPASGMTLVGERGPELVDLPGGSYVHDAGSTAAMLGGGRARLDLYVHNGAGMPADRGSLRQLAVLLQRELELQGVRAVAI